MNNEITVTAQKNWAQSKGLKTLEHWP